MSSCFRRSFPAFLVLVAFSAVSAPAFADTYQPVGLGTDASWSLYGIDDAGTVVLDTTFYCNTGTCYSTDGATTAGGTTTVPPALNYDDGSPCAFSTAGYVVEHAVCNDGRLAWTGYVAGNPSESEVFDGPNPAMDVLASGGEGPLMLTATGDIVWDDHFSEGFYEALDTSATPEPGSWALLLTGVLAMAILARRRRIGERYLAPVSSKHTLVRAFIPVQDSRISR